MEDEHPIQEESARRQSTKAKGKGKGKGSDWLSSSYARGGGGHRSFTSRRRGANDWYNLRRGWEMRDDAYADDCADDDYVHVCAWCLCC